MSSPISPLTASELRADRALAAALLDLNNAHATELSWLSSETLNHLLGMAWRTWRIGRADGLMIALDETADYDNPNHRWFRARYDRFVYVDRIVVAQHARGKGTARRLYEALIGEAIAAGHARIVCEVNLDPPNPQSDAFHGALGFEAVATASIHDGAKTVRYLVRPLG